MRYEWLFAGALVLAACEDVAGPTKATTPGDDAFFAFDSTVAADGDGPGEDGDSNPDSDLAFDADPDADAETKDADADAAGDASSGPFSVLLAAADDALASYLMDAGAGAWNVFSGAVVPLGRHFDASHVSYHTAFRFTGVQVPPGATIVSAKASLYPTNEVDSSHAMWLNVYAEKAIDSKVFNPTNSLVGRPDQREKTKTFIDHWLVRCNEGCTDATEYDCPQRKLDCWDREIAFTVPKDLKALVQEVVDQPGWKAGNAITILVVNVATDQDGPNYKDNRSITGFDPLRGPEYSPRLVIQVAP